MEFTGERIVPGDTDPDLLNEHIARYDFAETLVQKRCVLDAGCGVGYGAQRLACHASSVTAFDIASAPLLESLSSFKMKNVNECQGDCIYLPFRKDTFDVVVAFEVIEHLQDPEAFLRETSRVLSPYGQLIVSTPNRDYYRESRAEPNPFHVCEFSYDDFQELLKKHFKHAEFFFENHNNAITFMPLEVRGIRTTLEPVLPDPKSAHFFVAVCSNLPLHDSLAFIYLPQSGNMLRDRERHIHLLEEELKQKELWLTETKNSLKKLSEIFQKEQKKAQKTIDDLEKENEVKTIWAKRIEKNYEERLQERTEWAKRLDRELNETCKELSEACKQLKKIYASPAYRVGKRLRLSPPPWNSGTETD